MDTDVLSRIQQTADNLHKNGFRSSIFTNTADACAAALEYIQNDAVGIGGSMTVFQLDLHSQLRSSGNNVYWHWMVSKDEINQARRKAAEADLYLCSSNAITIDGKLVNIDGAANRVAAMIYGPKRTLIIAGRNKICEDVSSAIERVKRDACGKNARRLQLATPCAKTDACCDCDSPDRMCSATVIVERPPHGKEISVFIIDEDLGY